LASILDKYQNKLPETLDDHSFPYQISLLTARLRSLHHHDNLEPASPYNFYIDSHVPEIRRAAILIESLKKALDVLAQEWPDQMVLQHLRDRCAQILSLSAESPVAKILVLLEQLLLQTDDWEMYASQETTLKKHRDAITELVISWRRLELSSWRGLLQTQAQTFEEGVSEWWFRLYNAIVRGLLDILDRGHSDSLDDYLDQLVPLLDDFLKLSPLGQFSRRLDLLRSFEPLLQHLALIKSEQAREPLSRVQRIVHSTQAYYTQFVSSITSSFTAQEKEISEEIQGFIKVASWKDVNVQALKASAKKTHHQLHKAIRKYRDIMRQPVNEFLQPERVPDAELLSNVHLPQSCLRTRTVDSSCLLTHLALADGPAHLQNISKTYGKFDILITSRIDSFVRSVPSHNLDNLMEQIIYTAKELASVNIPVGATVERKEKLWKASLVRKRKAWSDFAKEFKRIGLATNVRSTLLLQQRNERWLREQPSSDIGVGNFVDVQNSEKYFVRLQGLLPRLRATLANHHGDISAQDLQRSIMLLESALSLSLNCRSKLVFPRVGYFLANMDFLPRLATGLNAYARLKSISQRLDAIHQSSAISAWGPTTSKFVLNTEESVTRMSHAISETINKINELGGLPGASPAPATLLDGAQTLLSSTQECGDALQSIARKLKETKMHVLLQGSSNSFQKTPCIEQSSVDELDTVAAAQQHMTNAQNLFLEWEKSLPQFRLIILPLRNWLASQILPVPDGYQPSNQSDPGSDDVIEALLISIQSVLSVLPVEDRFVIASQDNYLKDAASSLIKVGDLLRVDSTVALLNSWVERLAGCPPEEIKECVSRILPFVQRYTLLVEDQLACMARWVNSLFRLQFAACSVMLNIATNGFCKPLDFEEPGDEPEGDESGAGGVGFGEGVGDENVSREIEDESQVEGLKDEGGESNRRDESKGNDGDAIEMGDDFQGELENIPENGSEEERPTDEEEEGPEETLGGLDAEDPDTVDEKLWGDEAGPQDDSKQDKAVNDHSNKPSADSEVVAKENEHPKGDHLPKKKPDDWNTGDEGSNPELDDEDMPREEADEENGEDVPGASGAALDDLVHDSDILDLPDNLEMDEDTTRQDVGEDVDDDMLGDDADGMTDSLHGDNEMERESSPEQPSHPKGDTNNGESVDDQRQEGEMDTGLEDSLPEDANMQPDIRPGDEPGNEAVPDHSLGSNILKDPSESPSKGDGGVKTAGISEETWNDDASVRLFYSVATVF
jgi:midasin